MQSSMSRGLSVLNTRDERSRHGLTLGRLPRLVQISWHVLI